MLRLGRFQAENLRCIARVELRETGRLNVLWGPNGAGKTSVLEGIHMLATARSFRSRVVRTVVRHGAEHVLVAGRVEDDNGEIRRLGLERRGGELTIRIDGESVQQASRLARVLPVLVMRPESHEVFSGAPEERRRLLDWAVFHVEPGFGELHARFLRALKQRNAALRAGKPRAQVQAWDRELADSGEAVAGRRQSVFAAAHADLVRTARVLVGKPVELHLRQGWAGGTPYADALASGYPTDRERGVTLRGPQRAELEFRLQGRDLRPVLSRGEGKRLVLALLLTLAEFIGARTGRPPVLLVDDLASELDDGARAQFLDQVMRSGCQAFVTTVDEGLIAPAFLEQAVRFHVKQGAVERVV